MYVPIRTLVLGLLISCQLSCASACTAFLIHQDENLFLCKNFDWDDGDGLVVYNPSGKQFYAPETGTSWIAKYGSIKFCYKQASNIVGGMNEQGLVIEELSTLPFPIKKDHDKILLNEFQWIGYHLDNCASVEEVVTSQQYINLVPEMHFLHYLISDAYGDAAILEFGPGGCVVYRGDELPYPVLSNNPYGSSLKYLAHFNGFGGKKTIPESKASCDRFVIAAKQLQNITMNPGNCVDNCFEMLDKLKQHDTQWQIIYNIPDRQIYFRDNNSLFLHCINLDTFLLNNGTEGCCISLMGFSGSERLNELVKPQKPL